MPAVNDARRFIRQLASCGAVLGLLACGKGISNPDRPDSDGGVDGGNPADGGNPIDGGTDAGHPGTLDFNFGDHGIARGVGNANAYSVAVELDGGILVAGRVKRGGSQNYQSLVLRFTQEGVLDSSFGPDGGALLAIGSTNETRALALLGGKILAAGIKRDGGSPYDAELIRYNPDGTLDESFGSGGAAFQTGLIVNTNVIGLQSGRILLGGLERIDGKYHSAIYGYFMNGVLDSSFDASVVRPKSADAGDQDEIRALAVQPDQKIVVTVFHYGATGFNFSLRRHTADGPLDESFGDGGIAGALLLPGDSIANAVALQPNGAIVVVGALTHTDGGKDFMVARYDSNGVPDSSFGSGGVVLTRPPTDPQSAAQTSLASLIVERGGNLVTCGYSEPLIGAEFTLARYLPSGALDLSFGRSGLAFARIGDDDHASAIAVQADGKLLMVGDTKSGGVSTVALVRYLP